MGIGGSVVEYRTPTQACVTLGAWFWAGTAGPLATFGADITAVESAQLKDACRNIAHRYLKANA